MTKSIKEIDKSILKEAREESHKAVQLVAMAPRHLLEPDPTDSSASLIWNSKFKLLSSQEINGLIAGFEFVSQQIQFVRDNAIVKRIETIGNANTQVFEELKSALVEQGLDGNRLNQDLPYELPLSVVNRDMFKKQDHNALSILSAQYDLTNSILENIFSKTKEASDIRCWPHHFDLATLVTLEAHDDPEEAKSIGFGFSPGDGGYDEPYFYLTPWPYPSKDSLYKIESPAFWNTEGWVGGVLKAADIAPGDEKETVTNYFKEGLEKLKLIL